MNPKHNGTPITVGFGSHKTKAYPTRINPVIWVSAEEMRKQTLGGALHHGHNLENAIKQASKYRN